MKFATVSVLINVGLGLALFFGPMGFVGLAIATSVAGWSNTLLLAYTLHRRALLEPDPRLVQRLPRVLLACLIMGGFLWMVVPYAPWIVAHSFGLPLVAVVLVSGAGLGIFGIASIATGALRLGEVKQALKGS